MTASDDCTFSACATYMQISALYLMLAESQETHREEIDVGWRLRDILQSFGLNWSVNSPTRASATTSTTNDNVITNILKVDVVVFNPAISDHFAQEVVINGLDPREGEKARCARPKRATQRTKQTLDTQDEVDEDTIPTSIQSREDFVLFRPIRDNKQSYHNNLSVCSQLI
ncbi:hypothetical protein J6590_024229 [Homalodisca vitripennis]|nr:hypothetical protein J6590_024229 [Homalodisca vitripennis]